MNDEEYEDDTSLLRDLRKQLKDLAAANKRLEDELAESRSASRTKSLTEALVKAGYPDTVAKFVPTDMAVEELDSWLEENGSLFARPQAAPQGESPADVPAEAVAEQQRANAVLESGVAPQRLDDIKARIGQADSPDEVDRLLREARQFVL